MRSAMVCVVAVLMGSQRRARSPREIAREPMPRPAIVIWRCRRSPPPSPPTACPIHRVALDGTRATTILVAFDAGARTERPDENGMAHFLEHLVFKGGADLRRLPQGQRDGRAHGRLAERLHLARPRRLPHHRARRGGHGGDRPAHRLRRAPEDRSRPSSTRSAASSSRRSSATRTSPPRWPRSSSTARTSATIRWAAPCSAPRTTCARFSRDAIVAFRERRWAGARGGAFVVGNVDHVPANGKVDELFARFPDLPAPEAYVPAPAFEPQVARRAARHQPVAPAHELPPARSPSTTPRRAPPSRSTRRCWAARWARACSTRSASSAACATRSTPTDHAYADVPVLQLGVGPRVEQVRRGLHAHARDRRRAGRRRARRAEEVERARAYAAGRRVLAFENTNAVARYAANQRIVFDEDIDPDAAIALLDAVTFDEVAEAARTVDPEQARRRLRGAAREPTSSDPG